MSFQTEATVCLKRFNHYLSHKLHPLKHKGCWNTLHELAQTNPTVRNHSFGKKKILLVWGNHILTYENTSEVALMPLNTQWNITIWLYSNKYRGYVWSTLMWRHVFRCRWTTWHEMTIILQKILPHDIPSLDSTS